MEKQIYQITCPHCKRTIVNNPVIESAAKKEGSDQQFLICECGERITYWQITAQLRGQNKIGTRFGNWIRSLVKR
jgi:RNase P subunit RPR2